MTESELIEIPSEYMPDGIGPSTFDPHLMRLYVEAHQGGMIHDVTVKSWVLLYLLDQLKEKFYLQELLNELDKGS
jgi:hypothetical protein